MFWKAARAEIEALKKNSEADAREKEAARLDLHLSLRKLAARLEEIPIDDALRALGGDLAGNPR